MIKILKLHPLQGGDPSPIIVPKSEPGPCCSPANDDPFVICGFLSGCSTHPPPPSCASRGRHRPGGSMTWPCHWHLLMWGWQVGFHVTSNEF